MFHSNSVIRIPQVDLYDLFDELWSVELVFKFAETRLNFLLASKSHTNCVKLQTVRHRRSIPSCTKRLFKIAQILGVGTAWGWSLQHLWVGHASRVEAKGHEASEWRRNGRQRQNIVAASCLSGYLAIDRADGGLKSFDFVKFGKNTNTLC